MIFFPHTRNYSWADTLLVRSIEEFPEPIAYRSHKVGLKMVRDFIAILESMTSRSNKLCRDGFLVQCGLGILIDKIGDSLVVNSVGVNWGWCGGK